MAGAVTGFTALTLVASSPAAAHAIIELNGISAVAGKTSTMTLEVQHGCLPSNPTLEVEAFVGKPWRAVKPQPVAGWTSRVERQSIGGWHIIWTNTGEPVPFGTATFFPITVAWPKDAGVYDMTVLQLCPESSYLWDEPFGPATAEKPSPPLTPRPQVQVVAKPASTSEQSHPTRPKAPIHAH